MLYQLHELQHLMLSPYRAWLHASRAALAPWVAQPGIRPLAAGLELAERMTRRYGKPEFGIASCEVPHKKKTKTVRVREEIIDETPFCTLLNFAKEDVSGQPKVLLVAPLSGHYATLLRGTVEAMLPEHDVYITDWTDARDVPHKEAFHLDDYIELVMHHLTLLGEDSHVIAVCQPSVPVLAAVALMCEDDVMRPLSMTLMGGPVDTRKAPTAVNAFAKEHSLEWFDNHSIHTVPMTYPGFGRRVYPGFLQLQGFLGMNMERHANAHADHFWHLVQGDDDSAQHHRQFYDEYMSVMDLPAEYFLETVQAVFHDHALPDGKLMYRGRRVDAAKIKDVALFTIEGELDDISGVGQTRAAHDVCKNLPKSKRKHLEQKGVGHYGIFNGRKWKSLIQPQVAAFIAANKTR
ncbi:MAG TPA: polyhydroxyalkanoate depolymerase [Magnetovibrio sp.]